MIVQYKEIEFQHIKREMNKMADLLANSGISKYREILELEKSQKLNDPNLKDSQESDKESL